MKIALTTDHAGFELLKQLQSFLEAQGYECINYGPKAFEPSDDYPDFIIPAARAVASKDVDVGIIMGGSGQGEAIVANRIKGARCALYYGPAKAQSAIDATGRTSADDYDILRLSRQHNDTNMLSLGARFLTQQEMERAVTIWLETLFEAGRHESRIRKIDELS